MCTTCYEAGWAKQQQAQGLRCSGCGAEGQRLNSNELCQACRRKLKAEAEQRAAVEEYMAAKAKEVSKATEAQKRVLYL